MRTLLLNASYEPLCVVSARRAILLVLDEKVTIIEDGDDVFHSQKTTMNVPSVIKLTRFVKIPYSRSVPLNTRTVLARDKHKCAFCGEKATTIDHVDPRVELGPHIWENVVAACHRCNNLKGRRSLAEMRELALNPPDDDPLKYGTPDRWELLIEPSRPIGAKASVVAFGGVIEEPWRPYLGLAS